MFQKGYVKMYLSRRENKQLRNKTKLLNDSCKRRSDGTGLTKKVLPATGKLFYTKLVVILRKNAFCVTGIGFPALHTVLRG